MILGHCDEDVVQSIHQTVENAIAFGAPTELELKLAEHICTTIEHVEMIRMVNSGTEATMSAVKLARGYTKRDKIIKFEGGYHGHFDGFLVSAGSGVMTEGIPGSKGVPKESIKNTLIARYNDISNVKDIFKEYGNEIAGVIIEPVAGNMGVVPSEKDFLKELRKICNDYGSLLIFDEVMSGFRVAYKGAASIYEVVPDLITYAKIMGGGLPCGAYGGKKIIMEHLSPLGTVYQAGTMSGNPIVMTAGLSTLKKLYNNPELYKNLEKLGKKLEQGIKDIAKEKGLPIVVNRVGAMMTLFFTDLKKVTNYNDAKKCNTKLYIKFFEHMLQGGIYLPPSQFESLFLSTAHTEKEINKFLDVMNTFI